MGRGGISPRPGVVTATKATWAQGARASPKQTISGEYERVAWSCQRGYSPSSREDAFPEAHSQTEAKGPGALWVVGAGAYQMGRAYRAVVPFATVSCPP
jgi:hypothetical protein